MDWGVERLQKQGYRAWRITTASCVLAQFKEEAKKMLSEQRWLARLIKHLHALWISAFTSPNVSYRKNKDVSKDLSTRLPIAVFSRQWLIKLWKIIQSLSYINVYLKRKNVYDLWCKKMILARVQWWCPFYQAGSHKRAASLSPTKKKKEDKRRVTERLLGKEKSRWTFFL